MKITLLNKEVFEQLSQRGKRVVIAQDVLERIDSGNIAPYCGALLKREMNFYEFLELPSFQEYANENECEACAKGALMCSWVGNFNKYSFDQINLIVAGNGTQENYLSELVDIFGWEQLDLIEIAFEGKVFPWNKSESRLNFSDDENVNPFYKGDLIGIMENIIANGGEFVFDIEHRSSIETAS